MLQPAWPDVSSISCLFVMMERLGGFEISKCFDACDVWGIVVFVCVACCAPEEGRLCLAGDTYKLAVAPLFSPSSSQVLLWQRPETE